MRRHSTDLVSLVFGLVFAVIATMWPLWRFDVLDSDSITWFPAAALIVIGLLGLVLSISKVRTPARTPEASGDPAYGDSADGDPAYRDPAYGDQAYGDQAYGDPAHRDPAYGDPAEQSWTAETDEASHTDESPATRP